MSRSPVFTVNLFSEGKDPSRNEDCAGYDMETVVLSDGATDKAGIYYGKDNGQTGGEIVSKLIVDAVLASNLNGRELVDYLTGVIRGYYKRYNPEALVNSELRFAGTLVAARIVGNELVVTQVGDSIFRINGIDVYKNEKLIDEEMALMRRRYIERTGDIEGGRDIILPYLKKQHKLQNNSRDERGYGVIDGAKVPTKFIRNYNFPLENVVGIELISDGYFGVFPETVNIADYENLHLEIEKVDPYKIKDYSSTKVNDDRTVVIAYVS